MIMKVNCNGIRQSVNIRVQKSGTKWTKKLEKWEFHTKATSSTFSPPKYSTGTALHCVHPKRI